MTTVDELGQTGRTIIAVALASASVWKMRYPGRFSIALRAMVPVVAPSLASVTLAFVVFAEIGCAAVCVSPTAAAPVASGVAAVLIAAFSAVIAFGRDTKRGCGCWASARGATRGLYLLRNALLEVAAISGALLPGASQPGYVFLALLPSCVIAALLLELPGVAAFAVV